MKHGRCSGRVEQPRPSIKQLAEVVRQDKLRRLTEMVFDVDNDEIEAWSDAD